MVLEVVHGESYKSLWGRRVDCRYTAVEEQAIRKCLDAVRKQGKKRTTEVPRGFPGRRESGLERKEASDLKDFAKVLRGCASVHLLRLLRPCDPKGTLKRLLEYTAQMFTANYVKRRPVH